MTEKIYVHNVITGIGGDPAVSVGDLLYSTKGQRDTWADQWTSNGAPNTVRTQLESLFQFGRKAREVTDSIKPIGSPYDVIIKFAREKRKYPSFHWVTWPLDANKQHMVDYNRSGSGQYIRIVTKLVPSGDDLVSVEKGGGYILTFMGPPEVILTTAGAVAALRTLCERENVFDVLFRKYSGNRRITFSVKAGEGYYKADDGSSETVEFPDELDLSWFAGANAHANKGAK